MRRRSLLVALAALSLPLSMIPPGVAGATGSSSDVWAVGSFISPNEPHFELTLTEHWDGSVWTRVPSPNPTLSDATMLDVAAVAADDVWAVGNVDGGRGTLIEHWDGTAWTTVRSPRVSGGYSSTALEGVAAATGGPRRRIAALRERRPIRSRSGSKA